MSDPDLRKHRDDLRAELEQVRETTAQNTRAAGGDEAHQLQTELDGLEREVAALAKKADRLSDQRARREEELGGLRRETAAARRHLADLEEERT